MWIIHPSLGAFSVVLASDLSTHLPDPDKVMVRARRTEHLQLLQERCTQLADAEILETAATDYRWRIVVEKADFASALGEIAGEIDYTNVKSCASQNKASVGSGFVAAMSRIWSALYSIQ
jgi:hypothetical protein